MCTIKSQSYTIYSSWDTEWDKQKNLSFWAMFCPPILLPYDPENQNFMKKMPGNIIHFLYIHVSHRWRSHDIWFLKYKVRQTEIFKILDHFLPFQPLDNLENQNFNIGKKKNIWCITILHICTINDNHMMHDSWDMECNRHNFLSVWTVFCSFTSLMDPENQNFEKMKKKHQKILSFKKH